MNTRLGALIFFAFFALTNPASAGWQERSVSNAPAPRAFHTAVWTGSEMIVWGGSSGSGNFSGGGRYNPAQNTWTAVSTTAAPAARADHTSVWTGSEMIIWGGDASENLSNNGGRYNPVGNSWTAVKISGAPPPRRWHTAVCTGSEMIVWGGFNTGPLNDGGRYNPAGNSLQSGGEQLDAGAWPRGTGDARQTYWSHGGVDGQRDDNLGRLGLGGQQCF